MAKGRAMAVQTLKRVDGDHHFQRKQGELPLLAWRDAHAPISSWSSCIVYRLDCGFPEDAAYQAE